MRRTSRVKEWLAPAVCALAALLGATLPPGVFARPEAQTMDLSDVGGTPADTTWIVDFSAEPETNEWFVVNDGVMGGISSSEMRHADGTGTFEGQLSLANNGGFASVRIRLLDVDLSAAKGIALRVRGDGREYQLRFRTDDGFDGIAYRATFQTVDGEWAVVTIPIETFLPTYRGRVLTDVDALDPGSIRQLTFMVADNREGPFRIEIEWVKAF